MVSMILGSLIYIYITESLSIVSLHQTHCVLQNVRARGLSLQQPRSHLRPELASGKIKGDGCEYLTGKPEL
jgi:hypothetical protein